jgi:5-methylcytosine-specific restriction endonuclease McrA
MSEGRKGLYVGEKSGNWKGGATVKNLRARGGKEYRDWRAAALQLRGGRCQDCGAVDGHTCECCGTHVKLHVHHVFSFAKHPEKRFDPANSEVLCPKCHWSRHRGKIG